MRQWILTLVPNKNPSYDSIRPGEEARAIYLLDLWNKYVEPTDPDGDGDYEDFFEQAVRLEAAIDAFGLENVWLVLNKPEGRNLSTGEIKPVSEIDNPQWYGIVFSFAENSDPRARARATADSYVTSKSFHKFAGRKLELAGFSLEGRGVELVDSIKGFAEAGHRNVIIKTAQTKKGIWDFPIAPDLSEETIRKNLFEMLDWSLINFEGSPEAYLVQEKIVMRYEYRIFVINGRPVTGAGCIEENTPLSNKAKFDPWMREDRRGNSIPESRSDLVEIYLDYASKVIDAINLEEPELKDYVIDFAVNESNEPVLIERNGFENAGFYACNVKEITKALKVEFL